MGKGFKIRSKGFIKETSDIVLNTENDEAAVSFLMEAIPDEYPDLELGTMDLHEAIKVLDRDNKNDVASRLQRIEDINKSLTEFINESAGKKSKVGKKTKGTRKAKRNKR